MSPLETIENDSLVRLEAVTGRQHQLRVHMAHVGHPIVNDPRYDIDATSGFMQLVSDELWIPEAPHLRRVSTAVAESTIQDSAF